MHFILEWWREGSSLDIEQERPRATTSLSKTKQLKMIAVIQRVSAASVAIEGQVKGHIGVGFLVLLGIATSDMTEDLEWLGRKIVQMRIFGDAEGKMNLDLKRVNGNILLISQFTLQANTKKGNRPSFIEAARPEVAIPLYEQMIDFLSKELGQPIQTGEFGADMKVSLINDGPVTIIVDSENRGQRLTGIDRPGGPIRSA